MSIRRREVLSSAIAAVPILSGCATTYARFRAQPGSDWGYVVVATTIELPSALRIVSCSFGGTMVGTEDNFMLKTDIAMVSTQKLDISTAEVATVVDVQPLPPGRYALNHIGYYANALQSWRIFHNVAPQVIDVPAKTVLYMGEYVASQGGGMSVRDREQRDMSIAMKKYPHLSSLPRKVQVPGARPRMDAGLAYKSQQSEA